MKFNNLKHWQNLEDSSGLILFAQYLDELLFEYTLDTYKPSAMNTSLLILEGLEVVNLIERGVIHHPNLKHILDELCENLDRDKVAQYLLTVDLDGIKSLLKNPKAPDASIAVTLELLGNQIPLGAYKAANEILLISEIIEGKDPAKIRSLTRSYITTLVNVGYSIKHIQKSSKKFFFNPKKIIEGKNEITDYLKLFNATPEEYVAIYKGPKQLSVFSNAAEKLGIKISEKFTDYEQVLSDKFLALDKNETYLLVSLNQGEMDPYAAKAKSDMSIEQLQTLIGLYHHKTPPNQIIDCLIIPKTTPNRAIRLTKSINPMHKCADLFPEKAAERLSDFMNAFSMQKESFVKFNRSAELHALALSSDSIENQMINLWIALESLIPQPPKESKVCHI